MRLHSSSFFPFKEQFTTALLKIERTVKICDGNEIPAGNDEHPLFTSVQFGAARIKF